MWELQFSLLFSFLQNLALLVLPSIALLRALPFLLLSISLIVLVPLFSPFPYTLFLSSFLIHPPLILLRSSLSSLFTHNPSSLSSSILPPIHQGLTNTLLPYPHPPRYNFSTISYSSPSPLCSVFSLYSSDHRLYFSTHTSLLI